MPWVRIDEHALNHVKLLALSDRAFRLWVEGLAYCQRHLSNGEIDAAALRTFRYASAKAVTELTARVGKADPLWMRVADTYLVHDYLEWNDDRATVERRRGEARERMAKLRGCSREQFENNARTASEVPDTCAVPRTRTRTHPVPPGPSDPSVSTRARADLPSSVRTEPDELGTRAGAFCTRYAALHAQFRNGAKLVKAPAFRSALGGGSLEFQEALALVETWDDARLDKLAEFFLRVEGDEWIDGGPRTIARFRSRATWCDDQLAAYEKTKGAAR